MVNFPSVPSCLAIPLKESSFPVSFCRRWKNIRATVPSPFLVTYKKNSFVEFHVRDYYRLKAGSSLLDICTMSKKSKKRLGIVFRKYWSGKNICGDYDITATNFSLTTSIQVRVDEERSVSNFGGGNEYLIPKILCLLHFQQRNLNSYLKKICHFIEQRVVRRKTEDWACSVLSRKFCVTNYSFITA